MESLLAFGSIILLDIVLSGDNAIIIGALAATLPSDQRKKAIMYGMVMAVVMRIVLSLFATYLITIPYLRTAGAIALLWVAWGMYKDLTDNDHIDGSTVDHIPRTFMSALGAIALADLSMSIDNILGVAGAASGHWEALVFGLILSIAIMAFAANFVSNLIERYKWIAWGGLITILFVAGKLVHEDWPSIIALFN